MVSLEGSSYVGSVLLHCNAATLLCGVMNIAKLFLGCLRLTFCVDPLLAPVSYCFMKLRWSANIDGLSRLL